MKNRTRFVMGIFALATIGLAGISLKTTLPMSGKLAIIKDQELTGKENIPNVETFEVLMENIPEGEIEKVVEEELRRFREASNHHIASSLGISLEDYQEKEIFGSEKEIKNLLQLHQLNADLSLEKGDRKPAYFFKNPSEGVVLTQKAGGVNVAYHILLREDEGWVIEDERTVQGTPMVLKFTYGENTEGTPRLEQWPQGAD
ncbi:hypothetical protein [Alkaliphilus crotonatoxidans]